MNFTFLALKNSYLI